MIILLNQRIFCDRINISFKSVKTYLNDTDLLCLGWKASFHLWTPDLSFRIQNHFPLFYYQRGGYSMTKHSTDSLKQTGSRQYQMGGEIITKIKEKPELNDIFQQWHPEAQNEFLDICSGVKGRFIPLSFLSIRHRNSANFPDISVINSVKNLTVDWSWSFYRNISFVLLTSLRKAWKINL